MDSEKLMETLMENCPPLVFQDDGFDGDVMKARSLFGDFYIQRISKGWFMRMPWENVGEFFRSGASAMAAADYENAKRHLKGLGLHE